MSYVKIFVPEGVKEVNMMCICKYKTYSKTKLYDINT